ncbi:MAG: DUF3098 domain-containing protein [Solitalea-like symbiont of Acarus siro]
MVFTKRNYYLLALSVVVLITGFYLMHGSVDIMSNTKINVAPLVVIIGYILCGCSILIKGK